MEDAAEGFNFDKQHEVGDYDEKIVIICSEASVDGIQYHWNDGEEII